MVKLEDIVNHFGIIESPLEEDATYILKDGRVMSTNDGTKSQHENVANYINSNYGIDDLDENNGSMFMNGCNAIRVTPWLNAFYLPVGRITKAQENTLVEMIMNMKINSDNPLMVSSLDGMEFAEFTKKDIEQILDSITGYYIFGVLLSD